MPLGLFPCKIYFSGNPSPEEQLQKAMRREKVWIDLRRSRWKREQRGTDGSFGGTLVFLLLLDHSLRKMIGFMEFEKFPGVKRKVLSVFLVGKSGDVIVLLSDLGLFAIVA
jgi:hypothetical protein